MLEIFKDFSGKTYGYELKDKEGEVIVFGDGYDSLEEIIDYHKKILDVFDLGFIDIMNYVMIKE